jgi:hypothetical protein
VKVGDLIEHRKTKSTALIIKEVGPLEKKPHYYYKLLWAEEGVITLAPLDILIKLWRNINEN